MRKLGVIVGFAVMCASGAAAQDWETMETIGGAWDTEWGEVWVFQNGSRYDGNYSEDNGRFWLEFTDHVFEGYWAEDLSDVRCDVEYMGSWYWGRLELSNSDHFPGFLMRWSYCRAPVDRMWAFYERLPDGL